MDPVSAIVAVVNLLVFVDNVYRGVNVILKPAEDPRADALYVRLITEKARYAVVEAAYGRRNTRGR